MGVMDQPSGVVWTPGTGNIPAGAAPKWNPWPVTGELSNGLLPRNPLDAALLPLRLFNPDSYIAALANLRNLPQQAANITAANGQEYASGIESLAPQAFDAAMTLNLGGAARDPEALLTHDPNTFSSGIGAGQHPEPSLPTSKPLPTSEWRTSKIPSPHELAPRSTWAGTGAFTAYHVTPHDFAPVAGRPFGEFASNFIGTGEGNLDYGSGFYLAENPATAEYYRKNLSIQHGVPAKTLQVAVRPNQSELLDWDAPMIDQARAVFDNLTPFRQTFGLDHNMTGKEIYNFLSNYYDSQAMASRALDVMGIPGIKYLDAGSRSLKSGDPAATYNFNIFNPRNLKVIARDQESHPMTLDPVEYNPFPEPNSNFFVITNEAQPKLLSTPSDSQWRENLRNFIATSALRDMQTGAPFVFFHGMRYPMYGNSFLSSSRGGVSLSISPKFASDWIGTDESSAVYPVIVQAEKVGDFRNPTDVDRVARYYIDQNTEDNLFRFPSLINRLERGDWELWEDRDSNGQMLSDLGFDATHMVEDPSDIALGKLNLFVRDPARIKSIFNQSGRFSTENNIHAALGAAGLTLIPISHDPFGGKK